MVEFMCKEGLQVIYKDLFWNSKHSDNFINICILPIHSVICVLYIILWPIPVVARSKACVRGRSIAGIAGSNPAGDMDACLSYVLCAEVDISALGRLFVQKSPTQCDLSDIDLETSKMRRPWPTRGCCVMQEKNVQFFLINNVTSLQHL
jgi:hypothetical protein